MNDQLNESTTKGAKYIGEWCNVGVLLPERSEGSHELKMWFLCHKCDILLYHSELQLLFHISYYMATVVMVVP